MDSQKMALSISTFSQISTLPCGALASGLSSYISKLFGHLGPSPHSAKTPLPFNSSSLRKRDLSLPLRYLLLKPHQPPPLTPPITLCPMQVPPPLLDNPSPSGGLTAFQPLLFYPQNKALIPACYLVASHSFLWARLKSLNVCPH